jgi:hypothetical protein
MLAGDQHLATIIHHGVNDWNDSGYSFCVPSIVNYWGRKWMPLEEPHKKVESPRPYTGEYLDGFGNKVTMLAYANPGDRKHKYGPKDRQAAGFGIVRFNKAERTITMECWPRNSEIGGNQNNKQYPGWPITITQEDNYAREAMAWLPEIQCKNMHNPVIQVINEANGKTTYTLRIKGSKWQPKVFQAGSYTIKVGGQGAGKLHTFKHIQSRKHKKGSPIIVD